MTSPSRLDEVRRLLDAAPAASPATALDALRAPPAPRAPPPAAAPPPEAGPGPSPAPAAAAASGGFGVPAALARPVGWAAGLLAVAGIIHLVLLPGHLEEARGIGLYFCLVGGAQVVWALLFALRPTRRLAWAGVVALVVQPIAVYVLTRVVRQPFGDHAEGVDFIGVLTGLMEVAALAPLAAYLSRTRPAGVSARAGVVVPLAVGIVLGIAFGAALYGAGLVAEDLVPWLDEPEEPHTHGHAAAPAGDGAATGLPAGSDGHSHSHG